jgi:hypothetical protein
VATSSKRQLQCAKPNTVGTRAAPTRTETTIPKSASRALSKIDLQGFWHTQVRNERHTRAYMEAGARLHVCHKCWKSETKGSG